MGRILSESQFQKWPFFFCFDLISHNSTCRFRRLFEVLSNLSTHNRRGRGAHRAQGAAPSPPRTPSSRAESSLSVSRGTASQALASWLLTPTHHHRWCLDLVRLSVAPCLPSAGWSCPLARAPASLLAWHALLTSERSRIGKMFEVVKRWPFRRNVVTPPLGGNRQKWWMWPKIMKRVWIL